MSSISGVCITPDFTPASSVPNGLEVVLVSLDEMQNLAVNGGIQDAYSKLMKREFGGALGARDPWESINTGRAPLVAVALLNTGKDLPDLTGSVGVTWYPYEHPLLADERLADSLNIFYLYSLAVDSQWHNHGIGSILLDSIIKYGPQLITQAFLNAPQNEKKVFIQNWDKGLYGGDETQILSALEQALSSGRRSIYGETIRDWLRDPISLLLQKNGYDIQGNRKNFYIFEAFYSNRIIAGGWPSSNNLVQIVRTYGRTASSVESTGKLREALIAQKQSTLIPQASMNVELLQAICRNLVESNAIYSELHILQTLISQISFDDKLQRFNVADLTPNELKLIRDTFISISTKILGIEERDVVTVPDPEVGPTETQLAAPSTLILPQHTTYRRMGTNIGI